MGGCGISTHDCGWLSRRTRRRRQSLHSRYLLCVLDGCVLYIVHKLMVGLQGAIQKEKNPEVAAMLNQVCLATVVSWCTYPVVYLLPFMGISGAKAVVGIQLGYCASD